jgi:hypothetical protein
MNKDRYIKISSKWWHDTLTGKWIHNDHIDNILFGKPKYGTKLPNEYRNKKNNKMY